MLRRTYDSQCRFHGLTHRRLPVSLINTQIKPFSATAYQNGKFIDINQDTLKGKWAVVVLYQADFTFV